jgi:DNA-binding transcriptional regulator YhcF (GntR family)
MNKLLKYNQAKYEILNVIAQDKLKVGDCLPSERDMGSRFNFSLISLRRALKELAEQGYVEKRHGSGTYLTRPVRSWDKKGEMMFLEIVRTDVPPAASTYQMREFLRERNIDLKILTAIKPDTNIAKMTSGCIGIFISGWINEEWLAFLKMLDIPMLFVGSHPFIKDILTVEFDWEKAAFMMVSEFVNRGHRKIGLITGSKEYYPSHLIYNGFCKAKRKAGLEVDERQIAWVPSSQPYEAVSDFLRNDSDYDAIVLEPGPLLQFQICCWGRDFVKKPELGIIGGTGYNKPSEKVFFISFKKSIYLTAVETFFESLNQQGYFKKPILIEPVLIQNQKRLKNMTEIKTGRS